MLAADLVTPAETLLYKDKSCLLGWAPINDSLLAYRHLQPYEQYLRANLGFSFFDLILVQAILSGLHYRRTESLSHGRPLRARRRADGVNGRLAEDRRRCTRTTTDLPSRQPLSPATASSMRFGSSTR